MGTPSHFILLCGIIYVTATGFNVRMFADNPGMYYEKLGQVHLETSEWNLITFINVTLYDMKYEQLTKYYYQTMSICSNNKMLEWNLSNMCKEFSILTQQTFTKIKKDQLIFKGLLGHREKRGLMDIVGKGFKVLFGTLDSDDAEEFHQQILKATENENKVKELLEKQTSIVNSALKSVNMSLNVTEANNKIIQENFGKLGQEINNIRDQADSIRVIEILEGHIQILNMMIHQYQLELSELITTVIEAQRGILHPSIITPGTIKEELQTI